jgi:hypothetical protein
MSMNDHGCYSLHFVYQHISRLSSQHTLKKRIFQIMMLGNIDTLSLECIESSIAFFDSMQQLFK